MALAAGLLLATALLSVITVPALLGQQPPDPSTDSRSVIIGFQNAIPSNVDARVDSEGGSLRKLFSPIRAILAETKDGVSQSTFINRILAYNDTEYAVPDLRGYYQFVPGDTYYANHQRWYMTEIGLEEAWDYERGDGDFVVAVIDTGVSCFHEDFLVAGGSICDPRSPSAGQIDATGHGTYVAGTLAAVTNNNKGVAGTASVKVLSLPVPTLVLLSDVVDAILQANELNVKIITTSIGFPANCGNTMYKETVCLPLKRAIQHAHGNGVLIFAAAGNEYCGPIIYPAAYDEIVAVGSGTSSGRSDFSNCGTQLDVLAPGAAVFSTTPQVHTHSCHPQPVPLAYYCMSNGTSFSTPLTAGIGALVWIRCPALSRDMVRSLIESEAYKIPGIPDTEQGKGLVQANKTLIKATQQVGCS
jgi:subtilisin family serine protease